MLAFHTDRDGNFEVYTMNADGSSQLNISNNPAVDAFPNWCANGPVAYQSTRTGNSEIFTANPDGTNPVNVTNDAGNDAEPNCPPDCSKIAFDSDRDGDSEIFTMDADGANPLQLTANGGLDFEAAWSPEGDGLAFITDRDGDFEVYSMGADGTGAVNLTTDPAAEFLPDWQPLDTASPTATPGTTPIVTEIAPTTAVLAGATEIDVDDESIFSLASFGIIGAGTPTEETFTVAGFGSLLLQAPLQFGHDAGESVALASEPTPTPTATPAGESVVWGDNNCSDSADPFDSLLTLRFDAGLSTNIGDCPAFGQVVEVANASPHPWGDVDCSGFVNPIVSLKLLRFDAGLGVTQAAGCPLLGATVSVTE